MNEFWMFKAQKINVLPGFLTSSCSRELHVLWTVISLTDAFAGFSSFLQMYWNSFLLWITYKKKWRQSLLFSITVLSRCLVWCSRQMVSVIVSWADIVTALSSNNRSVIWSGSNSSYKNVSYSFRHVVVRERRFGDNSGLPDKTIDQMWMAYTDIPKKNIIKHLETNTQKTLLHEI